MTGRQGPPRSAGRPGPSGDAGQTTALVVPLVAGLVALALVLLLPLADAADDRTRARTAADAAALAGASAWAAEADDRLGVLLAAAASAEEPEPAPDPSPPPTTGPAPGVVPVPAPSTAPVPAASAAPAALADLVDALDDPELGPRLTAAVRGAVDEFATANDAQVDDLAVGARGDDVLQVTVVARQPTAVETTTTTARAPATARLVLRDGVCLTGGGVGLRTDEGCEGPAALRERLDADPWALVDELGRLRTDVGLVA